MNAASLQCGYFAYAFLALDLEILSYLWRNLSYGCILFAFFIVFGPVRFVSLMNAAAVVTAATQNFTDVFQHALHLHYSIKVWIIEIVHRLSFNYNTLCAPYSSSFYMNECDTMKKFLRPMGAPNHVNCPYGVFIM